MYDLHLHTYWSYDATARPAAYIDAAVKKGIKYLAITEHHNVDSFEEIQAAAQDQPVQVIRAAELSVTTSVGSIDLLCYNLPENPGNELPFVYQSYHNWQRETGAGVVKAMQKLGYDYTDTQRIELLDSFRPSKTLTAQGNTHVQNELQHDYFIKRGFISSVDEYKTLMASLRETGLMPPYPMVDTVTNAVKNAGGLVVIAHPHGYFQKDNRQRMDLLRKECNLDGIECSHPKVPKELGAVYRKYCTQHNLISTAGSDTHHEKDIPERLGKFANNQWLDEFLARIE